jgi:lysophospholipase L1-like esterase
MHKFSNIIRGTGPVLNPILADLRRLDYSSIRGTGHHLYTPRECFTDAAGTIRPTDGQEVLRADDQLGIINATATATNGLVFTATGFNGGPGWYCAGSTDKLTATSALVAGHASAFSIFVLVSLTSSAADSLTCPVGGAWGYLARKWRDGSDWRGETTGTSTTSLDVATANSEPVTRLGVAWLTWDGTTKRTGINGIYAESTPGGTFTPTGNLTIGNANAGSFGYTDPFGDVLVCQAALTVDEVAMVRAMMLQNAGIHSTIVCDGDSLLTGFGLTNGKIEAGVAAQLDQLMGYATVQSTAIGGNAMSNILADDQTTVARAFTAHHDKNICFVWCGTNDVDASTAAATIYADLVTYSTAQRALGFKVIVGTVISRDWSGAKDIIAGQLNSLLRAGVRDDFDGIANLDLVPELADHSDTDYFQGDGIHLTAAGATIAAQTIRDAIERFRRAA